MKQSLFASLILASLISVHAQDAQETPDQSNQAPSLESLNEAIANLKADLDGHKEGYLETKNTVDKLAKIKVSGYTQFQYRYATDTVANKDFKIGDMAGGDLYNASGAENVNGLFAIRRGRLKVAHEGDFSNAQAELEILPNGVSLKDLQFGIKAPFAPDFGLKVGIMDAPFGFEVGYSSSNLEIAERSRVVQSLFPGEKDMGARFYYTPGDNAPALLQHIDLTAGAYTGQGGKSVDLSDSKNIVGRLGLKFPFEEVGVAVDGGVSVYRGSLRAMNDTSYALKSGAWTSVVDASSDSRSHDRNYTGFDLQTYVDVPYVGGLNLRGEYISGQQPGSSSGSASPAGALATKVYDRNFAGYYAQATLNLGKYLQLAYRFDNYDPNTDVAEKDFKAGVKLNTGDVAYATNSLGLSLFVNGNTKVAVYYDMVKNEKVAADVKDAAGKVTAATINKQLTRDLPDNVLNVRLQYKF